VARCDLRLRLRSGTGDIANRRLFASTAEVEGSPDGAAVDAEGFLWNARVAAGQIARYDPDGRVERTIRMPVLNTASVMFGGPDLDILFVTSMARLLPDRSAPEPEAGSLFAIRGLGIKGLPEPRFAG
jgi:L-arabinonolactonase